MAKKQAVPLKNAVVIVTGGARGIGLATAKALVAHGAKVAIGDIDVELAQKEAAAIGAIAGELDVRRSDSFRQFFKQVEAELGAIDILINNAGIMPMGAFVDEPEALSDAQIDINFRGVLHGTREALASMTQRNKGHIINVASLAGRFSLPGAAVYCGTKSAVISFTESVAGEYRNTNLHFTVVMPSKVTTELSSGTDKADAGIPTVKPEQIADGIVQVIKRPRLFLAVPDYLRFAHGVYGVVPVWMQQIGRKIMGDTGILTSLDNADRRQYTNRLSRLTKPAISLAAVKQAKNKTGSSEK